MLAAALGDLEVRDRLARACRCRARSGSGRRGRGRSRASILPLREARPAADERQVGALELAAADERGEAPVRLLGAGDDEQPRGVPVEPVDDARPPGLAAGDEAGEQVDERPAGAAGAGMDDQPGRLVDDGQVLVLPGDPRRRARRRRRAGGGARRPAARPARRPRAGSSSAAR